jgi:hypothetical protein
MIQTHLCRLMDCFVRCHFNFLFHNEFFAWLVQLNSFTIQCLMNAVKQSELEENIFMESFTVLVGLFSFVGRNDLI